MSEFIITKEPEDKKRGAGRINDVVFCYTKIQEPTFKYGSKTDKEYSVDVVVDKATAKAWKKKFPKNSVKELDNDEFARIFKIDPPYKGDEQYVLKVKARAQNKDGDPIPYEWNTRPKVFVPEGDAVVDVTMSKLVSNGSKGDVAFSISNGDFGTFPQLTGILVTNLIEYVSSGGNGNPFGKVKESSVEETFDNNEDDDVPF